MRLTCGADGSELPALLDTNIDTGVGVGPLAPRHAAEQLLVAQLSRRGSERTLQLLEGRVDLGPARGEVEATGDRDRVALGLGGAQLTVDPRDPAIRLGPANDDHRRWSVLVFVVRHHPRAAIIP